MESNGRETPEARGEAAHKTIRKHFPTLMKIVATGDIVETLYAEEIIEESTFEIITAINTVMSNKQKGTKILKDVQIAVHSKPEHFETFCKILEAEKNHTDVVQNLKGIELLFELDRLGTLSSFSNMFTNCRDVYEVFTD